jgi:ribosomal protein L29
MISKDELKKLSSVALKSEIDSLKKELFNLRLGLISGQIKDISQFKKLRIQIARAQTFLRQQQLEKLG